MKVKQHLSLERLEQLERAEKDAGKAKRLRIVVLAMKGWTAPAIGMAVGLSRRVCQQWVYRFNGHGLDGLKNRRGSTTRPMLSPEQKEQMRQRLDAGPTEEDRICSLRGKDIRHILESEFGVRRSLSAVYDLLYTLGYSYLRPRPKHHKSDPEAQEKFKRELPKQLSEIAARHPGKKLRVFFQDEARFGQQGTLTNVWAPTGSRPQAVRQTEYEYLWVLGAVCPETGQAEGLLSPRLNTDVINVFLRDFSATLAPDEHAVMIWDGAGFHRGNALQAPENVTLILLPPYSPELNPMENLWHYLKSHYWSNRIHEDYDALEKAAIAAWHEAVLDAGLMKTVCSAPYVNETRCS
jgi:transposase